MRRFILLLTAVMTVNVLAACADRPVPAALLLTAPPLTDQLAPGRDKFLLAFTDGMTPEALRERTSELGGRVDAILSGAGIAIVSDLTSAGAAELAAVPGVEAVAEDFTISTGGDDEEADAFGPVEPVRRVADAGVLDDTHNQKRLPSEAANYAAQWNMRIIEAPAAWEQGVFGSPSVRVYLLDTGVDYTRVDLRGHVDTDRSISFVPGDALGEYSAAAAAGVEPYMDFHSHGTAVASTIVSRGIKLAGVTTKTKIVAVKILDRSRTGDFSTFVQGLKYAADDGADIIHVSLAHNGFKRADPKAQPIIAMFERMTKYAHEQGAVIVVAAGNNAANLDDGVTWRPCNAPFVVCVSATGPSDKPASYSNYGVRTIAVAGPGGEAPAGERVLVNCSSYGAVTTGNVAVCAAGAPHFSTTGTTYGAAATSGLLALIVREIGRNNPDAARDVLTSSADDLGAPGRDKSYGYGRINVRKALVQLGVIPKEPVVAHAAIVFGGRQPLITP